MTNEPEVHSGEEIRYAFQVNGDAVRGHLNELVRSTVEETLNRIRDAEAVQLCGAKRYERSLDCVEEALVEMYLAVVPVRRVEDTTEALWGTRVSSSTLSELNQKIYARHRVSCPTRALRPSGTRINDCWAMDFMTDELFDGRRIRLLTIVDHFTRESLAIEVEPRFRGQDVVLALE